MRLLVSPAAVKGLSDMPQRDRDMVIEKAAAFAAEPFARHAWASPLRGTNDRVRIRQGDWRAVVLILRARDAVVLERVAHRLEVYR
jgi:mRNA interferase RelE/StbE